MELPSPPVVPEQSPAAAPADLELIERIRQGEQPALDLLYKRYSSPVYSLVWKILQNSEEAEDVALDVFWQVWRQADRYNPARGAPPAWMREAVMRFDLKREAFSKYVAAMLHMRNR